MTPRTDSTNWRIVELTSRGFVPLTTWSTSPSDGSTQMSLESPDLPKQINRPTPRQVDPGQLASRFVRLPDTALWNPSFRQRIDNVRTTVDRL